MKNTSLLAFVIINLLALQTDAAEEKTLAAFKDPVSVDSWISVNDGVMGGVSKGGFKRTDEGTLLFSGNLSLENNGGFASIRTKPTPMDLSGMNSVVVKAKGDGRTYWVELRANRQMGASSYRADLPTTAGKWTEVIVPIKDFKLQAFGQVIPSGPINLAKVESLGFTLADKKAGPFELEVEYVKTVADKDAGTPTKGGQTIVDVAGAAGSFKTLLAAAAAADLAGALAGPGPFTVFAPTDEAFAKLPKGTVEELLKPENREKLATILKYHVIAGKVTLAKALEAGEGVTLQGSKITAKFEGGRVLIGPATLLNADIAASNGVIHVIDQVLLPKETTSKPLTPATLIELAIERGVPLFNEGNPAACAAVYEVTCEALRAMPGVPEKLRMELAGTINEMRAGKHAKQKAWILRNALDGAYMALR